MAGIAGAAVPRAGGALVAAPRYVPEAGPVLAGDDAVAWVSRRGTGVLDLWVAASGGRPRRIQRFSASDSESLAAARLSASSAAVGLELSVREAGRGLRTRSYLGALGQPLRLAGSCRGGDRGVGSIALSGMRAAVHGPGCRATVTDGATTRTLPGGAFAMRLAGPFEAWLEQGGRVAVVRDGASGREITRVPTDGPIVEMELREDGTLALASAAGVALVEPGASRARALPLSPRSPSPLRWIGGALAVVAAQHSDPGGGVLQTVDVAGAPIARLAELGRDRELMRRSDVTAGMVVWTARGCASAQIRLTALPVPATVRSREPACRLRLRRRARVRGDRLRLGVSCAGFVSACSARVTVRAAGRTIARGTARPNPGTPPFAAANLRLGAATLRALSSRGRLRVRISARFGATEVKRSTTRTIRKP